MEDGIETVVGGSAGQKQRWSKRRIFVVLGLLVCVAAIGGWLVIMRPVPKQSVTYDKNNPAYKELLQEMARSQPSKDDILGQMAAADRRARLYFKLGDYEKAIASSKEAQGFARQQGLDESSGWYEFQGDASAKLGQKAAARSYYDQALNLLRKDTKNNAEDIKSLEDKRSKL